MKKISKNKNKGPGKLNIFFNKRYKFFNVIIFIGVLIIGYFVILSPGLKVLSETREKEFPSKIEELKLLEDYVKKMDILQATINSFESTHQSEAGKLAEVLPAKAQLPEIIAQVDSLVNTSGFRLTSFDAFEEESVLLVGDNNGLAKEANIYLDDLHSISIALTLVGGDYLDFKKLLDNFERNTRIFDLVSIGFGGSAFETSYSIILRTYYFEEKI